MKLTRRFAHNSKKAFTLVELVVVIAILAVLAAIAIPAVINIINSATKSQTDTDAASIDSAVKTFHAGIVNGVIYQENLPASVTTVGTFPIRNSSNGARSAYANNQATIQQAMQYAGIWDRLSTGLTGGDFGYADGAVISAIDGDGNILTATANGTAITRIIGPTAGSTIIGTVVAH